MSNYPVLVRYGSAVLGAGLAVFFRGLMIPVLGMVSPYFILYPVIIFTSFLLGLGPGVLASGLGMAAAELWLVPRIGNIPQGWTIGLRVVIVMSSALAAGYYGSRLRAAQAQALAQAEELRRLGDQRRLALESGHIGTWDLKMDSREILFDEYGLTLFGMARNPDVPTFLQAIHPEDRSRVDQAIQQSLNLKGKGEYREEFRVLWPDGSAHWLLCEGLAYFEGRAWQRHVVRFIGTAMDTTERKQMETELERQRELLQSIIDNIPAMIVIEGPDQKAFHSNQAFRNILGWSDQDLQATDRWEKLFPEPQYRQEILKKFNSGDTGWQDFLVHSKDDTVVDSSWSSIRLSDGSCVCMGIDLRERKRDEASLREKELRFRTLADNIAQLAWMADAGGELLWLNQRWLEYSGKTLEDMQHQGWLNVIRDDFKDEMIRQVRQSQETGNVMETVLPLLGRTGQYRWFLLRSMPIFDPAGKVDRWFGTGTDITEKQQEEQALRDADRRKDEFLAMLAHELRNPLAPIRNAVQILRLSGHEPGLQRQFDVIDRQVSQMARLLDDLLDVTRIGSGKIKLQKQPLTVAQILNQAIENVHPLMEARRHVFNYSPPPLDLRVEGDLDRLAQVVTNLLTNATKYTPEKGTIWLESGRDGDKAIICVRDTGMGIAPEMLDRVFEQFTQASRTLDRSQGGLGIGLAIVRRLVEMHGGTVQARSSGVGQGSEFRVWLAALSEFKVRPAGKRSEKHLPGHPLNILVVDDAEDAAESLAEVLSIWGHHVKTAYSGPAALQTVHGFAPDVVVLDIGLPGMNGFEVAQKLRSLVPASVQIDALTGFGQENDRRAAEAAGIQHYLVKPVDLEMLQYYLGEMG
jgi:PAS domain S-box-containing protein